MRENKEIFYELPFPALDLKNLPQQLESYGFIIINNNKVKFLYGLKSPIQFTGILPVSTEVGSDSILNPFTSKSLEELKETFNTSSKIFRFKL